MERIREVKVTVEVDTNKATHRQTFDNMYEAVRFYNSVTGRAAFGVQHLTAVSLVLKERFTNLSVAETLKLSTAIIHAIEGVEDGDDT